ncbi:MAG: hypothetical protein QNJ81_02140 [Acidimicrobiia bacterium]|nr:hypothetical protein [Acidimicrobiia bacterium]
MAREKIDLKDNLKDVIVKMAEGNPGGLTVMMKIMEVDPMDGLFRLLDLDDMNIRGSQIWVGYKDHCGQDIATFIEKIKDRDPEMVDTINRECYHPDLVNQYPVYGERARVNRHS